MSPISSITSSDEEEDIEEEMVVEVPTPEEIERRRIESEKIRARREHAEIR